jgi:hypothetical protein
VVALLLLPVVVSLLVLAAHFLRSGNIALVGLVLVFMALLAVRRRWAARLVQVALLLGALEWVRTMAQLIGWRSQAGQPVLRMGVILGAVTLVTLSSALVFRSARLRRWYGSAAAEVGRTP